MNKEKVIEVLNQLLEREYAGVVRYSHYSLMIYGYNRIPIVKWLRDQAAESLVHAEQIGELVSTFGGHPSLKIAKLLETHKHAVSDILTEALAHEREQVAQFHELLAMVKDENVMLEEFTRDMILQEETHISEIEKMLRAPGVTA